MMELIKKKRAGFYFSMLTLILSLYSFINYITAANDSYGFDAIVIVLYVGAIASTVIFMIKDFGDAGAIVTGILSGATFGMFIKGRFVYFATGLLGISQDGLNSGIMMALIAMLVVIFVNIIGAFFSQEKYQ